jgi:hypothetical protein
MAQDRDSNDPPAEPIRTLLERRSRPDRPILGQIEDHWREIKARSLHLPHRADLDPSRIAAALPHAFVLERAAPGVARLRIVGRALSNHLGTEARGLPLSVFFTPASRDILRRWLERCFDAPAILELSAEARQGVFRTPLTGRLLLLPMLDRDGKVTRALGGLVVEGTKRASIVKFDLAETPSRFQILPQPSAAWAAPATGEARGMAEPRRAYLRLVVDNTQP